MAKQRKRDAAQDTSRAYLLDWASRRNPGSLHEPVTDPTNSGHLHRKNLGVAPVFAYGRIVDAVAFTHCYRVLFERDQTPLPCIPLAHSALLPFGARETTTYGLGAHVWCLLHPHIEYGLIIGVEPAPMTTAKLCRSDQIHQASHSGIKVETMHEQPFLCQGSGGVVNAAAGRPIDSVPAGEWGAMTETGLRILLDSYMAQIGVDEATGIFAFYHDQLLRVAGYNTHQFDSGHEYEGYDDQTETYNIRGYVAYPWEALGKAEFGSNPFQERGPNTTQVDEPWYSKLEPGEDDQQAYHRWREFHGYLGQGNKRFMAGKGPDTFRYEGDDVLDGLFEEQVGLTGSYFLRSAKRITLAKRPAIPTPKRVKKPEDKDGDTPDDYRFSGALGSGDPHKVSDRVRNKIGCASGSPMALQTAAGVLDVHAHLFNWDGCHPFFYHEKDWFLPEEDETTVGTNMGSLPFGSLAGAFYMPDGQQTSVDVDHRYGTAQVFQNYSYVDMLDDGGVVIGDGFGAEIRMTGGHLFLTAPGDVWLNPGRNANILGGHDTIIKAHNSVDVSATKTDVRIKAEKNFHVIGGNSETQGGILLEAPTQTVHEFDEKKGEEVVHGGITFKAKKGFVTTWANHIYLRTGGGDVQSGDITLDCDRGQRTLYKHVRDIMQYVGSSDGTYFLQGEAVEHANVQFGSSQVWGKGHCTLGFHILDGFLVCRGGISVVGGHIGTEQAKDFNYYVGELKDEPLEKAIEALDDCKEAHDDAVASGDSTFQGQFTDFLYEEKQPGHDETIRQTEFTHRTVEQYRTSDFRLWESRWQQLARTMGGGGATWVEKKSNKETYPYPGKEMLVDEPRFIRQDLKLFSNGTSESREDKQADYEDPEFKEPDCTVMNGAFQVIM